MIVLAKGKVVRLRQGRLLAFDTADCLGAIGRTSAQLGPAAAQSVHPCLEKLLPLGLAYPGTNPPTPSLAIPMASAVTHRRQLAPTVGQAEASTGVLIRTGPSSSSTVSSSSAIFISAKFRI